MKKFALRQNGDAYEVYEEGNTTVVLSTHATKALAKAEVDALTASEEHAPVSPVSPVNPVVPAVPVPGAPVVPGVPTKDQVKMGGPANGLTFEAIPKAMLVTDAGESKTDKIVKISGGNKFTYEGGMLVSVEKN